MVPRLELANFKTEARTGSASGPLGTGLAQTIVAMITSNMVRAGHRSRVIVLATSENAKRSGLLMDSVIMTDNLATVHYSEIDRVIGTFTAMSELDAALRTTLDL